MTSGSFQVKRHFNFPLLKHCHCCFACRNNSLSIAGAGKPFSVPVAETFPGLSDLFHRISTVRTLHDLTMGFSGSFPQTAPCHLDGGQSAGIPDENALKFRQIKTFRQNGNICHNLYIAIDKCFQLGIFIAGTGNDFTDDPLIPEAFLKLKALTDPAEEGNGLSPHFRILTEDLCHLLWLQSEPGKSWQVNI